MLTDGPSDALPRSAGDGDNPPPLRPLPRRRPPLPPVLYPLFGTRTRRMVLARALVVVVALVLVLVLAPALSLKPFLMLSPIIPFQTRFLKLSQSHSPTLSPDPPASSPPPAPLFSQSRSLAHAPPSSPAHPCPPASGHGLADQICGRG